MSKKGQIAIPAM